MSAPRPISTPLADVVEQACAEPRDDDRYWDSIRLLQRGDPSEIWLLLQPLATADDARLRAIVPDVLRYLGGAAHPMLDDTIALFRQLLETSSIVVLTSVALAFVDLAAHAPAAARELLAPLTVHRDPAVRRAAVHGLLSIAARVVDELVTLSRDQSAEVREWATFGLGSMTAPEPSPDARIVSALVDRLADVHLETRAEAIVGLAQRGDARALPVLRIDLERGPVLVPHLEAATALADESLLPALRALVRGEPIPEDLAAAIVACAR